MPDSPQMPAAGSPLIGRQQEIAALRKGLGDAIAGQGRLVLLSGEPGIGKTRLARELASSAEHEGATVIEVRCPEEEGAPPYWPWRQLIRAYINKIPEDQVISELGAGAPEIAELVPEVRTLIPDLQSAADLEADQSRFRLFDSIASFLKTAASSHTLVVVMDDLHWADRSSLMLLEFLAREMRDSRLLFVGTYRDIGIRGDHPLANTLGSLVLEPHFLRVHLSGLTDGEVEELCESEAGAALPSEIVDEICRRTNGNPLFVGEIVRLVTSEESGQSLAWTEAIPEGVRNAIGRRLARLSDDCNQTLRIAAVIGKEFDYPLLDALSRDLGQEALIVALEEASAQGVIEEIPLQNGGYRFLHNLVHQTIVEEISTARRGLLHERIATEMELRYGASAAAHASELAHRFALCPGAEATDKLIHYSRLAGEHALAAFAYDEASTHFQRALTARGGPEAGGLKAELNDEAASILFGLARAQSALLDRDQLQEARKNMDQILEYYLNIGDESHAVEVAVYPIPPIGGTEETIRNLERIISIVTPETAEEGVLQARYGFVLGVEAGDYEGSQAAFERALAVAKREADSGLEMRTLADAARVDAYNHHWESSLEKSLRAMELAQRAGNTRLELDARYRAAWALFSLGDAERAKEQSKPVLDIAGALRDRYWMVNALWLNELLSRLSGDWQAATEFSEQGLAIWPRDPRLLGSRTLLEFETGNLAKGEETMERLMEGMASSSTGSSLEYANVASIVPLVSRITGDSRQLDRAARAAESVISSPDATEGLVKDAIGGLGMIAVIKGEQETARNHYTELSSSGGQMLFASLSGDRILGLLAGTSGEYEKAVDHFQAGLAFCRRSGYLPELAWTCHDYADALVQRRDPSGHAVAHTLLEESVNIATELGMQPLLMRLAALQEQAATWRSPAPTYPDGLTKREVQVLQLICGGKTDREIGEELFISISTAGNHVSNILSKTGTANRTEAATYAARHGLTQDSGDSSDVD